MTISNFINKLITDGGPKEYLLTLLLLISGFSLVIFILYTFITLFIFFKEALKHGFFVDGRIDLMMGVEKYNSLRKSFIKVILAFFSMIFFLFLVYIFQ